MIKIERLFTCLKIKIDSDVSLRSMIGHLGPREQ